MLQEQTVSSQSPHQIGRIQAAAAVAFLASSSKFQTRRLVGSIREVLEKINYENIIEDFISKY